MALWLGKEMPKDRVDGEHWKKNKRGFQALFGKYIHVVDA